MQSTATIREATEDDTPALRRLLGPQTFDERVPGRHHVLVVDGTDGHLAAAAVVDIEGAQGHIARLVVAAGFAGDGLEQRLIGVAEALCRAFGAETFEVTS